MSQPTRSNSPFAGPTPTTIPTATTEPLLPRVLAVMTGLQHLYDQVAVPGALLHEAVLSDSGRTVTLAVSGIVALSAWFDAYPRSSVSCAARVERRADGHLYGLGGLEWSVGVGRVASGVVEVVVTAVTVEQEELPDTELVRALCPWQVRLRAVQVREVAAHRVPGVAA